ncbi:MAG: SEL1-like repeat protein [Burkholderiales bacterium]|nr:SEL1-like repeat protein [Phycisphaerae bacterium]
MSETPPSNMSPSEQVTASQGIPILPEPNAVSQFPVIQIDGYRILNEISRGGQAVVYCAQFLKTGRRVAVKVMREGPLATEGSLARFNREVQILASLNHPNIVTILDRGRSVDGSEYFAMDFIEGHALDDGTWKLPKYMERMPASTPLQLFLKICDAINAAHLRGIVHRDLKPSNIRLDARGEPHVLDFGLARGSMSEELPNSNEPVTITGQFLGSLPWASPEQAEGIGQKIDMRSDVYSLGVILYQLVTGGTFPYQVVGSMRDVLNNIMTAQPPAPSQIMSERESRDVARRMKRVASNTKLVNSALDSIILKALAKRRDDRYQSAGDLARDIEAYLAGRPLQASDATPAAKNRSKMMLAIAAAITVGITVWATRFVADKSVTDKSLPGAPPASDSALITRPAQPVNVTSGSMPAMVASSPLRQEYQDLETIMNRFLPITNYIHANSPARLPVWRAAAEKSDPVGQFLVSRCYDFGAGVERNTDAADRYLRLAVDQKLPMAICMMGIHNRASLPPIQNYPEAIQWYTQAVEAGNARAMIDLGIMYSRGQGTPMDIPTALRLLQQAADLGAPAAYAMIGDIYRTPGNGVTDFSRAVTMYKQAIGVGSPSGSLSLGQMYASGNGVPKDYAEAMRLLKRADAEGARGAAEGVGDLYSAGSGVDQDYQEAARWYQKAANANSVTAMRKLAVLYEHGNGLPKDQNQATTLYTKAAAGGDAEAKNWVAANAAPTLAVPAK